MFTSLAKKRSNLTKDRAESPLEGGPGVGPGAESDALAGDEDVFNPGKKAEEHQKMADFHRNLAGPTEGSLEEESAESPEFEAAEDPNALDEIQTPQAAFGSEATLAVDGSSPVDEAESPDELAGETPAEEEAEGEPEKPTFKFGRKKGPSAFNNLRKGGY